MTDSGPSKVDLRSRKLRDWLIDLAVGGIAGLLLASLVAVNFVIFIGVDQGYESSLLEVFEHSALAGVATLIILITGPVVGVALARRRRSR